MGGAKLRVASQRALFVAAALGAGLLGTAGIGGALARVVPGGVVLRAGDPAGDTLTVASLNTAFTNRLGQVGFVAALSDGQRMIWNDGPVFYSGEAVPLVLSGGESTMGISDDGGFVYSPSADGEDAVYTHGGLLLRSGWPIPSLPGLYSSFNSRPTMLPNGHAYWIGGTSTSPGGSTSNRHLFLATDPTDGSSIVRVLGGGDVIDGKTIRTSASNFDYWISDNGGHHIHVLDMNVTLNEHVYLDGGFVAQEGNPTGQGDAWSSFDVVAVNNDGNYVFTGDTDGPAGTDGFVAYNGEIVVREGDVLDGVTIPAGATPRAASINNGNVVVHMWGGTDYEHLFVGDGADLAASRLVLSVGDSISVDGDEVADWLVTDFKASAVIGPGLDLGPGGYVYLEADITPLPSGPAVEAILRIAIDSSVMVTNLGTRAGAGLRFVGQRPNPAHEPFAIRYETVYPAPVRASVFDPLGREVRLLYSGPARAGDHVQSWDLRDSRGRPVPSGTYYISLRSGAEAATRKVTVVR